MQVKQWPIQLDLGKHDSGCSLCVICQAVFSDYRMTCPKCDAQWGYSVIGFSAAHQGGLITCK